MSADPRTDRRQLKPDDVAHKSLARDHPAQEAQKSYHTVLEQQVQEATEELERPAGGLMLSSVSAGLDLGFGPFLMAVALTLTSGEWSRPASELLTAGLYAVGFIFVVIGRSALFTERTTSAVLPVLARRAGVAQLMRLWLIVLAGNLIGAAAIGVLIAILGPSLGIVDVPALGQIAGKLVDKPWQVMLLSAVAAGWLMGLLTWMVTAARDTSAQVLLVWMTAFVIGLAGLHHSIAGTTEVLMAVFAGAGPDYGDYGRFIVWAVLGNAIGGSCFVALLKFGHVRASVRPDADA